MTASEDGLTGGPLNAAIANEIGRLIADFTGRGATKSRAFVHLGSSTLGESSVEVFVLEPAT